jgi:indole-3-glycerol phosphate synthase
LYLDKILEKHRSAASVDARKLSDLTRQAKDCQATRGFALRLKLDSENQLAVIAEIKRRSPSRGALNHELNPTDIAMQYRNGGASCLSVLTDEEFFGGSVSDLQQARAAVDLPVLRKDFTVSMKDICDTRIMGADCVLLIAAALSRDELHEFYEFATDLELDSLIEVHDETELATALEIGATIIGVNQRDLKTFEVDQQRAVRMASMMPNDVIKVAESGVKTRQDAQALRGAGYNAVLVGESLVTSGDILTSLKDLCV